MNKTDVIQISVDSVKENLLQFYNRSLEEYNTSSFEAVHSSIETMFLWGYFPWELMEYANDLWNKLADLIIDHERDVFGKRGDRK